MKKRFDLYGWQSLPIAGAVRQVQVALGISLKPHESSYRGGEYYRVASGSVEELIVQSNFEDDEGYLAEPDFPTYTTLMYVTEPSDVITARLRGLSGLTLLRTEIV